MEKEGGTNKAESFEDTLQEIADNMRLLKSGLRNHDPDTVDVAMMRISNKYGEQITNDIVLTTMTILMDQEDWSFELEDGDTSPLI